MAILFTNNASATLANTLNIGGLTVDLASGQGAEFPSPSGGDFFYGTLEDAAGNIEIVRCTARSSDSLTVVRAQEGTAEQNFAAGARFEIRVTAATLNALLQSATAATTYAPLTHFLHVGNSAELLHAGNIAAATQVQGVNLRRQTGQNTTALSLRDDSGTEEASVAVNTGADLVIENVQTSGTFIVRANNSSDTPTDLLGGDPDGSTDQYYDGDKKTQTAVHGLNVSGGAALAPYNASVRLFANDNTTPLAAFGLIDATNELRINSYKAGYPVGLYGNNTGGTLTAIAQGTPDGAFNQYYAGSKKAETTATGVSVTGVVSQSTAPTLGTHLTTKDYVDASIADLYVGDTFQASTNGYVLLPGNLLFQWGQTATIFSPTTSAFISWPTPFGATPFSMTMSPLGTIGTGGISVISKNNSNFRWSNLTGYTVSALWQAIGLAP